MAVVLKVRRGEGDCVRTGAEPRAGLWGRQAFVSVDGSS